MALCVPRIAVGTAVAGGPPHRSQRARQRTGLLPWVWRRSARRARGAGCGVGVAIGSARRSSVPRSGRSFWLRRRSARTPVPGDLSSEVAQRFAVVGHGVVVEVSSHDAGEPASLFGDREMPRRISSVLTSLQLRPHPLLARDPLQLEPSALGLRADVREAEELERLRLAEATRLTVAGGEPSELDQPRLLRLSAPGRTSRTARADRPGTARRPHDAQSPPRSRRRTAR